MKKMVLRHSSDGAKITLAHNVWRTWMSSSIEAIV